MNRGDENRKDKVGEENEDRTGRNDRGTAADLQPRRGRTTCAEDTATRPASGRLGRRLDDCENGKELEAGAVEHGAHGSTN